MQINYVAFSQTQKLYDPVRVFKKIPLEKIPQPLLLDARWAKGNQTEFT